MTVWATPTSAEPDLIRELARCDLIFTGVGD
jgi:hypothetical protein